MATMATWAEVYRKESGKSGELYIDWRMVIVVMVDGNTT